jgi:hypothetical protein
VASGRAFLGRLKRNGGWVLALFPWGRGPILDLAGGEINHQLSGLAEISGALATVLGHAATMR